jgi:hypothetical protein
MSGAIPPICLFVALWRLEPPLAVRFRIKSALPKALKAWTANVLTASVQDVRVNHRPFNVLVRAIPLLSMRFIGV